MRFRPLTQDDLGHIVDIQLQGLIQRLAQRRITLQLTDAAKLKLAADGFDPAFGARPLKRIIQRELADQLAMDILNGTYGDGDTIVVDVADDALVFRS